MSIEHQEPMEDNTLIKYVANKLDQFDFTKAYVPGTGYDWKRVDTVMGDNGFGGRMEIAYNELSYHLEPKEAERIVNYGQNCIVKELLDVGVGVNIYWKPKEGNGE